MAKRDTFLAGYPALAEIIRNLNKQLEEKHPSIFGRKPSHPFLPAKRSKVIHDNLWGTVRFSWRDLALIDSPIMQRLRDIHQTGLAYHVYPSARHSRFEHCLGAATIASRVFDALAHKQRGEIRDIAQVLAPGANPDEYILRIKQELRLAALLHDAGHSLFSHTSERVYSDLDLLKRASRELTSFVGKEKGSGEVISFCLALTPAVEKLLNNTAGHLIGERAFDDYAGPIDLKNVALIIVGRSAHPYLQFLGDIVSSGFDADKLDYLLRDATAAGLPLRYDIDRYLYDVRLEKEILSDGEHQLKKLYSNALNKPLPQSSPSSASSFPYYDTYRLRLSKRAMNVIEQIVICKMMLFSYIYHHPKVRASEGLLARLLRRAVDGWRASGVSDRDSMLRFADMSDASLHQLAQDGRDPIIEDYRYRLVNRMLPREVYSISGPSATHAAGQIIRDFLLQLHDRKAGKDVIAELERAIGEELLKRKPGLAANAAEALAKAGVWVDAPPPPKFEDVDTMVGGGKSSHLGIPIAQVFPIREWTEAYEHYRYQVRIFAFSEYWELTSDAAKSAMQQILGISGDVFYDGIRHNRGS